MAELLSKRDAAIARSGIDQGDWDDADAHLAAFQGMAFSHDELEELVDEL